MKAFKVEVAVEGLQRGSVVQSELTPRLSALLGVGYLSEIEVHQKATVEPETGSPEDNPQQDEASPTGKRRRNRREQGHGESDPQQG